MFQPSELRSKKETTLEECFFFSLWICTPQPWTTPWMEWMRNTTAKRTCIILFFLSKIKCRRLKCEYFPTGIFRPFFYVYTIFLSFPYKYYITYIHTPQPSVFTKEKLGIKITLLSFLFNQPVRISRMWLDFPALFSLELSIFFSNSWSVAGNARLVYAT